MLQTRLRALLESISFLRTLSFDPNEESEGR
jgi:hypothetical protein